HLKNVLSSITGMKKDGINLLYGGGANVQNATAWSGYTGIFVGRASALATAPEGKDSAGNIAQVASQTPGKWTVIFNGKSFESAAKVSPEAFLAEYQAKGLDR